MPTVADSSHYCCRYPALLDVNQTPLPLELPICVCVTFTDKNSSHLLQVVANVIYIIDHARTSLFMIIDFLSLAPHG